MRYTDDQFRTAWAAGHRTHKTIAKAVGCSLRTSQRRLPALGLTPIKASAPAPFFTTDEGQLVCDGLDLVRAAYERQAEVYREAALKSEGMQRRLYACAQAKVKVARELAQRIDDLGRALRAEVA